jgi:hypothetical protein
MQKVAAGYGGKCLSKEYVNNKTPLQWMCKYGHTWDREYSVMQQQGVWCSQCISNETKLEPLKEIAENKGGKCLSEIYQNTYSKLKWRCAEGHTFLMTPTIVKGGAWCQECRRIAEREQSLNRLRKLAQKNGGVCLSTKYVNDQSKVTFQCAQGHKWTVLAATFYKEQTWCERCTWNKIAEKELQRLNKFVAKKGGKCISPTYRNTYTKLKWECARGHKWSMTAKHLLKGQWCKKCRTIDSDLKTRAKFLERLRSYVEKKGGKVLSEVNTKYKARMQCDLGHKWWADPRVVLHRKSWCQKCLFLAKTTPFEIFEEIAGKKGGKLLTDKQNYKNGKTSLKWECAEGHKFSSPGDRILIGRWCRQCQYAPKQKYLDKYKMLATKNGGKLLSTVYGGIYKPLVFQCAEGHVWETAAKNVSDGKWCHECTGKKSKSKQKLRVIHSN